MGLRSPTDLDCVRQDQLGNQILDLIEHIGHLEAYNEDIDTGTLKRMLEDLQEQQRKEMANHGNV